MAEVVFIVVVVVVVGLLLVRVIRPRDQGRDGIAAGTSSYGTEPSLLASAQTTKCEAEPSLLTSAEITKYEAEPSLLTPTERSFFGVLQQALGPEYYICPKVRLADIIRPARQPTRSGWQSAFNRISAKHVDFAICSSTDLAVVGVIELDDRTHRRFERGFRDGGVDAALSTAGLPVIRISAREFYSRAALKTQVLGALRRPSAAPAGA